MDFPETMVESYRINIRITREGVGIIKLTLYPSLRKRGTYPLLFLREGSGDEFHTSHLVK
jgi:hypothetical protein